MDLKHFQFKHPFTAMIAGPTGSGKTVLLREILKDNMVLFHNINFPINVLWGYGVWQNLYLEKIPGVEIIYTDGLPSTEELNEIKPNIVVLDDLMTELGNNIKLANLFTKGSHHNNLSVFFIVQNVFHQGSQMRSISLNCHYLLLLKNPRDKQQIQTLAKQIYPNDYKHFLESYQDATKEQFGYIKVDLKADTPEKLRLQSRITLKEHTPFSPIIYLSK